MVITILIIVLMTVSAGAETVTAYANIDDSNSVCNLLVDAMRNDEKYDVHNQFECVRTGEYEYKIAFAKKLSDEVTIIRYIPATYQTQAQVTRYTSSSWLCNRNGHTIVGNTKGSLASSTAETYGFQWVLIVAVTAILILIAFKLFRKTIGTRISYYGVKG